MWPVIKCFVIPPNSKIEQTKHLAAMTAKKKYFLDAGWHTHLLQFQGAQPDHVRVESSSCCFPRELVNFVSPRELVSFDPLHVTVLLQSKNVIELVGITIMNNASVVIYP